MSTESDGITFAHRDVGGLRLHVAEAGPEDGPLVILLHGFPEFWFGWRAQIAPLARAGFRVVAPDQRGYNLSDKPKGAGAYRLDALAADIFALADAYGRTTFSLVGHDWGAAVAWWMATLKPERLDHLAILNAPHPAVWRRAMTEDPEQRRKSRYVQMIRLPWLVEAVVRAGGGGCPGRPAVAAALSTTWAARRTAARARRSTAPASPARCVPRTRPASTARRRSGRSATTPPGPARRPRSALVSPAQ